MYKTLRKYKKFAPFKQYVWPFSFFSWKDLDETEDKTYQECLFYREVRPSLILLSNYGYLSDTSYSYAINTYESIEQYLWF